MLVVECSGCPIYWEDTAAYHINVARRLESLWSGFVALVDVLLLLMSFVGAVGYCGYGMYDI